MKWIAGNFTVKVLLIIMIGVDNNYRKFLRILFYRNNEKDFIGNYCIDFQRIDFVLKLNYFTMFVLVY